LPRIKTGESLLLQYISVLAVPVSGIARLEYDDGTDDYLTITATTAVSTATAGYLPWQGQAVKDGVVAEAFLMADGAGIGKLFCQVLIVSGPNASVETARQVIAADYVYYANNLTLGTVHRRWRDWEFNPTGVYAGDVVALETSWPADIGDVKVLNAQSMAGADVGIPSTAASGVDRLYAIEEILSQVKNDANVATRVHQIYIRTGFASPAVMTVLNDFLSTGITLTASEQGRIFIPRAPGLVQLNDNATITTADISPLPVYVTEGGSVSTTTTNKQATDALGIAVVVRRVA
jgi:hypothetical protein